MVAAYFVAISQKYGFQLSVCLNSSMNFYFNCLILGLSNQLLVNKSYILYYKFIK
jgi:hypothetical protein